MQGDLISRSALMNELERFKLPEDCMEHEWALQAADDVAKYTIKTIKAAPAVDAAPVVHAGWKDQDYTFTRFQCTACKSMNHSIMTKYCPDCGAKMDGDGFCHRGEKK